MNAKKTVYLAIVLFAIWGTLCSIWYLISVKGLTTDPATFNGTSNAIAIVEILFMIVGAFLIGFLVAYYVQEEPLIKWRQAFFREEHDKKDLQFQKKGLLKEKEGLVSEKAYLELYYKSELAQQSQKNNIIASELDLKRNELEAQSFEEKKLKEEIRTLKPKAAQLESEVSHLRFKIKQLEFENENKMELRVPKEDEISDLTQIQGIGPAISRKLYAMGIYSFKQIGSFDQKMIDQVGKALKYFPDRIKRDDWVGQAKRLA
ncbi:MAG: hypothetical protein RLN86_06390 [Cyclobacteriaceae bacterium]